MQYVILNWIFCHESDFIEITDEIWIGFKGWMAVLNQYKFPQWVLWDGRAPENQFNWLRKEMFLYSAHNFSVNLSIFQTFFKKYGTKFSVLVLISNHDPNTVSILFKIF